MKKGKSQKGQRIKLLNYFPASLQGKVKKSKREVPKFSALNFHFYFLTGGFNG